MLSRKAATISLLESPIALPGVPSGIQVCVPGQRYGNTRIFCGVESSLALPTVAAVTEEGVRRHYYRNT